MLCDLCVCQSYLKSRLQHFFRSLANIQTIMVNKQQSKESKFSDRKREVCSSPEKPAPGWYLVAAPKLNIAVYITGGWLPPPME